jgi:hypothetical protein
LGADGTMVEKVTGKKKFSTETDFDTSQWQLNAQHYFTRNTRGGETLERRHFFPPTHLNKWQATLELYYT